MPNSLTPQGITITTQAEDVTFLTGWWEQIYGQGINIGPTTQDGQAIGIYAQALQDIKGVVVSVYNSRDINQCAGVQLDQLVFWTARQGGTFTQQQLSITVSGACTLPGLDQTAQPVFTYQDPQGNQYQLVATQYPSVAGTYSYLFQAALPGAVSSALNTITVPVNTVVQVTAVNNPTTWTTLGEDEETDFNFRLRALVSTAIASQGFFDSLFAVLGAVPQATKIQVYENLLDTVSPNARCAVAGVPAHGIWAIVQGSAAPAAIAQAIYTQRSLGSNMRGAQSFQITTKQGTLFTVYWDYVQNENVYIQFTATSIDGINPPKIAAILAGLPALLPSVPGAGMNANEVATAVQTIDPNTLVTNCGLSSSPSGPFTPTITPTGANIQLVVLSANVFITPMLLLPQTATSTHGSPGTAVQFTGYGGTQTGYTYSILVNNSGGSVNPSTGLYTSGNTPNVTDTVKVVDSGSNSATATVTVS